MDTWYEIMTSLYYHTWGPVITYKRPACAMVADLENCIVSLRSRATIALNCHGGNAGSSYSGVLPKLVSTAA